MLILTYYKYIPLQDGAMYVIQSCPKILLMLRADNGAHNKEQQEPQLIMREDKDALTDNLLLAHQDVKVMKAN